MDQVMEFIKNNYQWLFGGIGVAIIGWIVHIFFKKDGGMNIKQKQKAGDNSNNTQIGQINEEKHE